MSYKLTVPCTNCPFRTDIVPYLQPERVREIDRLRAALAEAERERDEARLAEEDDA